MKKDEIIPVRNQLIHLIKNIGEEADIAAREREPDKVVIFLEAVTNIIALIKTLDDLLDDE